MTNVIDSTVFSEAYEAAAGKEYRAASTVPFDGEWRRDDGCLYALKKGHNFPDVDRYYTLYKLADS